MTPGGFHARFSLRMPKTDICVLALSCLTLAFGAPRAAAQTPAASPQPAAAAQGASPPASSQSNPYCEASPDVKAAIQQIFKRKPAPDETEYETWRAGMQATEALRQKYPNDFFAQQQYVEAMLRGDPSSGGGPWGSEPSTLKVIAEYKALHEQHPNDPVVEYLYATTLINRDTPAAIKLLEDALAKNPAFPWPHQALIRIYTQPNFLDRTKANSNAEALIAACPANFGAYSWLRSVDDKGLLQKEAAQLRQILQTRTDAMAIGAYTTLWQMEFKSHPRSDFDALRKQVAADVARIRALKPDKDGPYSWWSALSEGYQLTGDQKQAKWANDGLQKVFASQDSGPAAAEMSKWFKDHPFPKPKDPKEKKQAYWREQLKATGKWTGKYPKSLAAWQRRMNAMESLDDVPAADCAATAEKRYELEQANTGPLPLYWWDYFEIADFLSQKNVEPALEAQLAQKGLDTIAAQWENIPQADLNSTKDDLDYYPNFYWPVMKARGYLYEAEGYTRLKQPEKAQTALGKASLQLDALESDMAADESRRKLHDRDAWYHRYESQYWEGMARVADLQGRNTDAMAYYQSALVARFDSDQVPKPGDKDQLGDEAHQLWAKLGGTEEGWSAWYGQRANEIANQKQNQLEWEKAQEPLPSFELTDLHGKTWKPADLKGKVVFLNFWASW